MNGLYLTFWLSLFFEREVAEANIAYTNTNPTLPVKYLSLMIILT